MEQLINFFYYVLLDGLRKRVGFSDQYFKKLSDSVDLLETVQDVVEQILVPVLFVVNLPQYLDEANFFRVKVLVIFPEEIHLDFFLVAERLGDGFNRVDSHSFQCLPYFVPLYGPFGGFVDSFY